MDLGFWKVLGVEPPENRCYAQYYTHYPDKMKNFIISEISKSEPVICVVLATVALGSGLHASAVRDEMDYQRMLICMLIRRMKGPTGLACKTQCAYTALVQIHVCVFKCYSIWTTSQKREPKNVNVVMSVKLCAVALTMNCNMMQ